MGVTVEIEVAEILDDPVLPRRPSGVASGTPPVSEEARLDAGAERGLQEKLQHRRRVDAIKRTRVGRAATRSSSAKR